MGTYIVSYDAVEQRNYQNLYDGMKEVGGVRLLESVWGVELDNSVTEVRDWVRGLLDDDDKIVVIKVKPDVTWASRKCGSKVTDWLKEHVKK